MHLLKIYTLFSLFFLVSSTRVVGWWVGNTDSSSFPLEKFPWDIYTHIRIGDPVIECKMATCILQ